MGLMTRRQIVQHLRDQGFPIGLSTLNKLCAPAINTGPPIAGWFGRTPLYDPPVALEWAKARMTPVRGSLGAHLKHERENTGQTAAA
jgi:hypothetical protein